MTCAKNRVSLKIQVHPVVYDFYISRYGETFDIDDDRLISMIIPHILTLRPKNYKPEKIANFKSLDIVLHDFKFGRNAGSKGNIWIENRNHLSDNQQYYISRILDSIFKSIFHNFMMAHVMAANSGTQKEGIQNFCLVYRISENCINYEMLKKSWDRSDLKKKWKEKHTVC